MPTATISTSQIESIRSNYFSTWLGARNAASGIINTQPYSEDVQIYYVAAGRGVTYQVSRIFAIWDTSAYAGSITACDIELDSLGQGGNVLEVIPIESGAYGNSPSGPLSPSDFSFINYAQTYSGAVSWPGPGIIPFTGNANLIALANTGTVNICFVDANYDLNNIDPYTGFSSDDWGDVSSNLARNILRITYTAGYSHTINGVPGANIGSMNGVPSGNLGTVNGV